jgi:hypothetical protein
MNFIQKIFEKREDNLVKLQFQKFSRGQFKNRAIIEAKLSKDVYTIKTSAEFANELVRILAEKLDENRTKVTGAIISTSDLTGELDFKEKKQFQGVKKYILEKEMSGKEIINLINKYPKNFFALSFETENTKLKIKPKTPKSGKSGKGEEKPKADFCILKTKDTKIAESFVFEKPDFKKAQIDHTFIIEELIMPKNEKDFAKIREMAKRKGKIIRNTEIDEKKSTKEIEFEV